MSEDASWAGVRVVTFDAAGTLLYPYPSVGDVYAEVSRRHGFTLDPARLEAAFRTAFQKTSKDPTITDGEARERAFWRGVVGATTGLPEEPRTEAFFADLWETFAEGHRWRLFPHTLETLAELRRRGRRLGVISNWDRRLHRVLRETGLREQFDAVLISSEVGAEKPDPAIFRAAERALKASPDACLHVGDSRAHDLAGARAAGWRGLRVRHDTEPAGDDEIGNLEELLSLLP